MKMFRTAAVLAVLIGTAFGARADDPPRYGLSRDQARGVVLAYLKGQGQDIHAADFDLEDEPDANELFDFYLFFAYRNTRTTIGSIGSFAVNRKSAILWERLKCQELNSEPLAQLQDKLRQDVGLNDSIGSKDDKASASPCI